MKVHNFLKGERLQTRGKKKADPQAQHEEFRGKELPRTLMVVGTRV